MRAEQEELAKIPGVGSVLAEAFVAYFADQKNAEQFRRLLFELTLAGETREEDRELLAGKSFVITGSVEHFKNRSELKEVIEQKGGKVTGSVTSKTTFLINNDLQSTSSKNKKAKDLGIPIISEEMLLAMLHHSQDK